MEYIFLIIIGAIVLFFLFKVFNGVMSAGGVDSFFFFAVIVALLTYLAIHYHWSFDVPEEWKQGLGNKHR